MHKAMSVEQATAALTIGQTASMQETGAAKLTAIHREVVETLPRDAAQEILRASRAARSRRSHAAPFSPPPRDGLHAGGHLHAPSCRRARAGHGSRRRRVRGAGVRQHDRTQSRSRSFRRPWCFSTPAHPTHRSRTRSDRVAAEIEIILSPAWEIKAGLFAFTQLASAWLTYVAGSLYAAIHSLIDVAFSGLPDANQNF